MKKVLILAYDFPPYVSVGGLRPASWAKYLYEFDVFPIVVTRQWGNKYGNFLDYIATSESQEIIIENTDTATIIRTPYKPNLANQILLKHGDKKYKYLRKSVTAFYEIFQWIFNIGPKSKLYFAAKEYLENNKVDCIIATGDPFILFRYASKLSKKFKIPWIADYRDPWSQDCNKNKILKKWNEFNEKRYLKNVSLITTVSVFFKFQIETLIKNKKFQKITNGYDDNIPILAENIKQNSTILNIGFAGTIYKWHPIEVFLRTVDKFVTENPLSQMGQGGVKLNFYGINIESEIKQLINEKFPNLKTCINIFPKLKNEEYIKEAAKNNVFLLFNDSEYIGTKIYDYLAMKRQIILCFSNDAESKILKQNYYPYKNTKKMPYSDSLQADLIKETNSGIIIENFENLYNVLESFNKELKENGFIACNSENIENYSRKIQVQKLAEIITKIQNPNMDCFVSRNDVPIPNPKINKSEVNENLRNFITTSILAGLTIPNLIAKNTGNELFSTFDNKKSYDTNQPIAPPGAESVENLLKHCTSCHLCISKCPQKVLKPAFKEYKIGGIMQPVMKFDKGFCNFDCTLCSEVCPTKALKKITKEEKHLTQIGKVIFLIENCIVNTEGTNCGACSEHCPTQAISMKQYKGGLTIPEINQDICVGCGGCEYICPVRPYRAVYVEANIVHKKAKPIEKNKTEEIQIDDFGF